ncbi:DUF2497 domain-containing protein [Terrihabitans sp. B22-R8]|uniref:DUF2497 domain-containing protein n=1 Tax=Terrihabitans sp. B22-R8 TaxID=3425128 RepID=UPI00403C3715
MNSTAKAQEPTMEEILASIRRIIADDEAVQPRPALRAVPHPQQNENPAAEMEAETSENFEHGDLEDILDLGRPVAHHVSSASVTGSEPRQAQPSAAQAPEIPSKPAMVPQYEEQAASATLLSSAAMGSLIAPETSNAVASAFGSLTNTMQKHGAAPRTIEDLVQDMLRPMLKDWLDDNLPSLVERVVKAEIERVSRGGRR